MKKNVSNFWGLTKLLKGIVTGSDGLLIPKLKEVKKKKEAILIWIVVMLIATSFIFAPSAETSDFEATKALVQERVLSMYSDKIDDVAIYMVDRVVDKAEAIILRDKHNKDFALPFNQCVILFLDLRPTAYLGHPFRYYIFNGDNVDEWAEYETEFPIRGLHETIRINDTTTGEKQQFKGRAFDHEGAIQNMRNLYAAEPKSGVKANENAYAVLINGGPTREGNWEVFYTNFQYMYNCLKYIYGFNDQKIFVFFAGGALPDENSHYSNSTGNHVPDGNYVEINTLWSWSNLNAKLRSADLDNDGDNDVYNAAENTVIEDFFTSTLPALIDDNEENSTLFIYTFDHGSWEHPKDQHSEYLCTWYDDELHPENLRAYLSNQVYQRLKNINIVMQQCHSGGFITDRDGPVQRLVNDSLTITTAADWCEVATSGNMDEWWPRTVAGLYPEVDDDNDDLIELHETYSYCINHIPSYNPSTCPPNPEPGQHPCWFGAPADYEDQASLGPEEQFKLVVFGQLKTMTLNGETILPGAELSLWEDDILSDDLLGSTLANKQGEYRIGAFDLSSTNLTWDIYCKIQTENPYIVTMSEDSYLADREPYSFTTDLFNVTEVPVLITKDYTIQSDNFYCFGVVANSMFWLRDNLRYLRSNEVVVNGTIIPVPRQLPVVVLNDIEEDVGFIESDDLIKLNQDKRLDDTWLKYNYLLACIYDIYGDDFPATSYTGKTGLDKVTDGGMALRNGLAWFLTAAIANDPNAVQLGGQNIETNSWWQGEDGTNTNGQIVEGAIASFLWDLYDSQNEPGDNTSGWLYGIWHIFAEYNPQTIDEFMALWNYCDIFSVAQLNHMLVDQNIHILNPTDGYPLIVDFTSLNPVTVTFEVKDVQGNLVHNLTIDKFTAKIGDVVCNKIQLQEQANFYLLEIKPVHKDEIGLYNLEVAITEPNGNISSDIVINGVLYTNQFLIEKGLAWLKSKQNSTSQNPAYISERGGSIEGEFTAVEDKSNAVAAGGSWNYNNSPNAGITALALQAFLAMGHGIDDPTYGSTVEKAIDYLISAQTQSGHHVGAIYNVTQGYETAMAIVALKSALRSGLPEPLKTQVENALSLALNYFTQDVQDGWSRVSWRYNRDYTSQDGGDMSVSQWVILALEATDYEGKGVWNKIYNYIDYHKGSSGNQAWLGYQNPNERPRGNTLAGIWGLELAANHGVTGAPLLVQKMYNYIDDWCPVSNLLSPPDLHGQCVYSGGGYYYYIYELAKALALGGKTRFCEENWYQVLADRIDDQHKTDGQGNYYWTTGWTDPQGYNIPATNPALGDHGNTAWALLSLQVGTIPPESKFIVRLTTSKSVAEGESLQGLYLRVRDDLDSVAGCDENGNWFTHIPNSHWNSTGAIQELEIELVYAPSFEVEIHNVEGGEGTYRLDLETYQGDNPAPTCTSDFVGTVGNGRIVGTIAIITSIGGLCVYADPPVLFPQMELRPTALDFTPLKNNTTYPFEFTIYETTDSVALTNIDVYASDLVDEFGNVLPGSCFHFNPSHIDTIPGGDSLKVYGSLVVPDTSVINLRGCGTFNGQIVVESAKQTRSIKVTGKATIMTVFIPDTCAAPGEFILIPINVSDLTGLGLYSAEVSLTFDNDVIQAAYASSEGTIAEGWGEPVYNNTNPGKISIAMAGTEPLAGSGVLVYVAFNVVGSDFDSTTIHFEKMIFNDDFIDDVTDGIFWVCRQFDISGTIKYCLNDKPVDSVNVKYTNATRDSAFTDSEGKYKLIGLLGGDDYVVKPKKTNDARGSISAFDASLVLRYVVGLLNLSPCKMIAGDVNGNCWVNAYDASLILKYVVGLIPQFPVGKDWKFIPADFVLDTLNWCTAPDSVLYENLSENLCSEDWKGILYGDLSGNWANIFFVEGHHPEDVLSKLLVKDIQVNPGEEFVVPIEVKDVSEVYAAELSLAYDKTLLSLVDVKPGELLQGYYFEKNLTPQEIRLAMAGTQPIQGNGKLVYLTFKVLPQAQEGMTTQVQVSHFCLNETSAEGFAFNISISTGATPPKEFSLFQNYPNPFNPQTKIEFAVPVACKVEIKIYNVAGQLVKAYRGNYPAGVHSITWDGTNTKGEDIASGIYFYRMEAGNFTQQKKMVLMR